MTEQPTTHATFTLERTYPVAPDRVFAAWSDPTVKARWFVGPGGDEHSLDFRVGGVEINRGKHDGTLLTFESRYHDIVPDERIIFSSTLRADDKLSTVSLTTVELSPASDGTRLLLTQHGTYLAGMEQPSWREQGTNDQLTALGAELQHS